MLVTVYHRPRSKVVRLMKIEDLFSTTILKMLMAPYFILGGMSGFLFLSNIRSSKEEIIFLSLFLGLLHLIAFSVLILIWMDTRKKVVGMNKVMMLVGFVLSYVAGLSLHWLLDIIE